MNSLTVVFAAILIFGEAFCSPATTSPKIDFLEEAKLENFNDDEVEILSPILNVLQPQYDKLLASIDLNRIANPRDKAIDDKNLLALNDLLMTMQPDLESKYEYDINLPKVDDWSELYTGRLTKDEADDIKQILQDVINDAHEDILSLLELSYQTESELIKIDKHKILKFIYRMLQKIFSLGVQVGRTAYCTYSSIPVFNQTLHEGGHEIGSCYKYAQSSIGKLRKDVNTAISDIRGNVEDLIKIYEKIANRHSLLGKLLTVLLNVRKVTKDIKEAKSTAVKTIKEVKTDGPIIAKNIKSCVTVSVPEFVIKLNQTVTDLLTCITFVDDTTWGPEPEPESEEESNEDRAF